MPRRFLGTRQRPRSAVDDRLRAALVYQISRPSKFSALCGFCVSEFQKCSSCVYEHFFACVMQIIFVFDCLHAGVEELIGSQEKLLLIKQSVSSSYTPVKLITGPAEVLSSLVAPPPHPLSVHVVLNEYSQTPAGSEDNDEAFSTDVDFSRAEDFFQMETKIDERRDDSLLKIALNFPVGSFMESLLSRYALPNQRLAFIQSYSDSSMIIKPSSLVLTGQPGVGDNSKELIVSCQVCGEMFSSLHKFQRHNLIHPDPDNKKFLCQICGKRFNRADHLNRHAVLHGDIVHKCLLCGEEFDRASHLDRHRRKNHPPAGQAPSTTPPVSPRHRSPLTSLSTPGSVLEGSTGLGNNLHLLAAVATPEGYPDLSPEELLQLEASRVVAQIVIGDTNKEDEQEKKTNAVVERPYKCDVCSRKFIRATHLRRHMRIHTGEKPFACHICGRRYARGDYLRAHIHAHRRDRVHKCKHCSEIFYDLIRFAEHCRVQHKDVEDEYGNPQHVQTVTSLSLSDNMTDLPSVVEEISLTDPSSPIPIIPISMEKVLKADEVEVSAFMNQETITTHPGYTHPDFLPVLSNSQAESPVILHNGCIAVPDSANEITVMSQPKLQQILDPLTQFIISSTGAIEVAHMIPVDHTH